MLGNTYWIKINGFDDGEKIQFQFTKERKRKEHYKRSTLSYKINFVIKLEMSKYTVAKILWPPATQYYYRVFSGFDNSQYS